MRFRLEFPLAWPAAVAGRAQTVLGGGRSGLSNLLGLKALYSENCSRLCRKMNGRCSVSARGNAPDSRQQLPGPEPPAVPIGQIGQCAFPISSQQECAARRSPRNAGAAGKSPTARANTRAAIRRNIVRTKLREPIHVKEIGSDRTKREGQLRSG